MDCHRLLAHQHYSDLLWCSVKQASLFDGHKNSLTELSKHEKASKIKQLAHITFRGSCWRHWTSVSSQNHIAEDKWRLQSVSLDDLLTDNLKSQDGIQIIHSWTLIWYYCVCISLTQLREVRAHCDLKPEVSQSFQSYLSPTVISVSAEHCTIIITYKNVFPSDFRYPTLTFHTL